MKVILKGGVAEVMGENFREIWETQGAAIGADWQGMDLLDSGQLFRTMASGVTVEAVLPVMISVRAPSPYGFVNMKYPFLGITETTRERLSNLLLGGRR